MKPLGKCSRCGIEVNDKDHYMKVEEHVEGKKEKENFIHKRCWDELMDAKKVGYRMINKAMGLLNKAEQRLE